jgi:quercetin dioxygenase-like cupin family protein
MRAISLPRVEAMPTVTYRLGPDPAPQEVIDVPRPTPAERRPGPPGGGSAGRSQAGGVVTMSKPYTHFPDLLPEIEPPAEGTLSRTLHQDERLKAVLFGFSAGQELPEHTASTPAVMHFLKGEATVTLGDDPTEAPAGAWIHLTAGLRHRIRTRTPVVMLLLLLK